MLFSLCLHTLVVVFGETPNPKKSIPGATRQAFLRIGGVYIVGVFILGISVSPLNPALGKSHGNAAASPFVIAIQNAQIKVLPSFVNACLLFFVGAAANSDVYLGSRSLYGLARNGMAPTIFLKLKRNGNPYYASIMTSVFSFLAYMTVSDSSADIFNYLTSAVSVLVYLLGLTSCLHILHFFKQLSHKKYQEKIFHLDCGFNHTRPMLHYF